MKADERALIETLLAPLGGLTAALAPLRDLPAALRALAAPVDGTLATAIDGATIATLAGLDVVPGEDLPGAVKRIMEHSWREGREHACAASSTHGAAYIIEPALSEAVERARMAGQDEVAHLRDVLGLTCPSDFESVKARFVRALDNERRLPDEVAHALETGRRQGRAEIGNTVLEAAGLPWTNGIDALPQIAEQIRAGKGAPEAIERARAIGRAEGEQSVILALARESNFPGAGSGQDPRPAILEALRDSVEADLSLREVRERAAQNALLAVLDELQPGARHERTGIGKIEDMSSAELRGEIARSVKAEMERREQHARQLGREDVLDEVCALGVAHPGELASSKEGLEQWATDVLSSHVSAVPAVGQQDIAVVMDMLHGALEQLGQTWTPEDDAQSLVTQLLLAVSLRIPSASTSDAPIEQLRRTDDGSVYAVWSACRSLGVELSEAATVRDACDLLSARTGAIADWARDSLPLLRLWDAQLTEDCPLTIPALDKPRDRAGDLDAAFKDEHDDWIDFVRDVGAVAEGDDVDGLVSWLAEGKDARAILAVLLERVSLLEDKAQEEAESDTGAESDARVFFSEELARRLFEHLPPGIPVEHVAPLLQGVEEENYTDEARALRKVLDAAQRPRDLGAWFALSPGERNRLIDRTRDALAAVAA